MYISPSISSPISTLLSPTLHLGYISLINTPYIFILWSIPSDPLLWHHRLYTSSELSLKGWSNRAEAQSILIVHFSSFLSAWKTAVSLSNILGLDSLGSIIKLWWTPGAFRCWSSLEKATHWLIFSIDGWLHSAVTFQSWKSFFSFTVHSLLCLLCVNGLTSSYQGQ